MISLLTWLFPTDPQPPLPRRERIERCLQRGEYIGSITPYVQAFWLKDATGETVIRYDATEPVEAVILELDAMEGGMPNTAPLTWTTRRAAARLLGEAACDGDGHYWSRINSVVWRS